jgi:phosphatidylglycerol lysyltransferase
MTATLHRPGPTGSERQDNASGTPDRQGTPRPQKLTRQAWKYGRRVPVTLCFLAAVWGVGLVTGSITHSPSQWLSGIGLHNYWWIPLSGGLLASGLGTYLAVTLLGLLILAPAEYRMGATRTFTTLLVSQTVGLLLTAGLIRLVGPAHGTWLSTLTVETAVGALPGMLGAGFALSCTLVPLWGRRLRVLMTIAVTISALYIGHLELVALACGAAGGLVAVALMYDGAWPWRGLRVPQHEVRVLVAMLVAVPALGLLTTLIVSANGPMPLFSLLSTRGHDAAICPHAELADVCRGLREEQLHAPALPLLLFAYGLRRGRRLAWWLAVATNLALLGFSIWIVYAADAQVILSASETVLLPAITLVVLLFTRGHFDQTADRQAVRKLMATLGIALGTSFGAFLLLAYLLPEHPSPLPTKFVAYMLFSHRPQAASLLYTSVFLLFWIVILGALTTFFLHTCTHRDADAADRARAILMRGGSTISYLSTWSGNKYWISQDGRAAIAYRPIAGVAVTVGEPYGDPEALDSAITEFAGFCEHQSLQPCLYSVTSRALAVTERLGWKSVLIAEDTMLPLARLQFAGKKWQNVRNAMNKAAREGITAEWCFYPEAPLEIVRQIRQISGKWVADKGLPEMGFTLGGLAELDDPNVRCLIAVGGDRTVHAITSWMPVYEGGRPVGWTLDLMRRNTAPDTSHGVMEFLIATAALTFQEEGARFVSLSGAPLARLDRGEDPCAVQRLLDVFANAMEPVYGFQALLQFKDKFHPDYQPLYLAYPDPAAIGSIATAIGRAYLPNLTSRQALRLLTKLRWSRG